MSNYANGRTPAPVDQDGELDFKEPPAKRARGVSIQLSYHGALVDFTFDATNAPAVHEIEQSIDTLLKRDGWAGTPSGMLATQKPKAERVKPFYDGSGDPCCPVHCKPLKEGSYGLYCSCRAKDGEAGNDKGYCSLRFIEG